MASLVEYFGVLPAAPEYFHNALLDAHRGTSLNVRMTFSPSSWAMLTAETTWAQ